MIRCVLLLVLLGLPTMTIAAEVADQLPQPDYQRQPSDPAWRASVVQFHGHLGPAVVVGARMGMIGLRAVEAKGYFDVEVTCEGPLAKPPQACFLDGVQVATGATTGNRTLHWTEAERILVWVKNTRTGRTACLRPTPALMDLLAAFKPQPKAGADGAKVDDARLAAVARQPSALKAFDRWAQLTSVSSSVYRLRSRTSKRRS